MKNIMANEYTFLDCCMQRFTWIKFFFSLKKQDVQVSKSEQEICELSSNSSWVSYIHFCEISLRKGINPPCPPPAMG